jgi:hypothetical protein
MSYCFVNPNLADQIVGTGWSTFQDLSLRTYDVAVDAFRDMSNFYIPPNPPLAITFDLEGYTPGVIALPDAPTRQISAFTMPALPSTVSLAVSPLQLAGPAPEAPAGGAVYVPPSGDPGEFDVAAPDATIDLELISLPDEPDWQSLLPTVPTLLELELPDAPTLNLPTFQGVRPDLDFPDPSLTFGFTEAEYSSTLLDAVKARLIAQGQGGTGLPAAIETALFDAARARVDAAIAATVQGVAEDYSHRGFSEPAPILARRMMQVRQQAQSEKGALSRDLMIRATDLEREQLRDFVAQGIALEQVLIASHQQREQRAFEAARYVMQATIDLFNARLQRVLAEASLYETDAKVYAEVLRGELARLEVFRVQLEAERARGELNEQRVRIYAEQYRGVMAMVEIYKASVDAATARNAINTQRIEAKRAEVGVFAERVRAYEAEWTGYGKRVDASLGVLRGQELTMQTYNTMVGAWQTKNQVGIEAHRGEIAAADLRLRGYLGDLDRFGKQLAGETGRMGAESNALAAEASVYEAGGRIAVLANDAENRSFELRLRALEAEQNLQLESSRANLTLGLERSKLVLNSLEGLARVASQLAASMASAVNLSASISASDSNSHSCNESYTFSGEIADA